VAAAGHDFCSCCLLLSPHTKLPVYSKLQDTLSRQPGHILHGNRRRPCCTVSIIMANKHCHLRLANTARISRAAGNGSFITQELRQKVKVTQLMGKVSLNDQ